MEWSLFLGLCLLKAASVCVCQGCDRCCWTVLQCVPSSVGGQHPTGEVHTALFCLVTVPEPVDNNWGLGLGLGSPAGPPTCWSPPAGPPLNTQGDRLRQQQDELLLPRLWNGGGQSCCQKPVEWLHHGAHRPVQCAERLPAACGTVWSLVAAALPGCVNTSFTG